MLVKKLSDEAKLPVYATDGASGMDLFSLEEVTLQPKAIAVVGTGVAFDIPSNHEVQIRSRSGLAAKSGVIVLNSPGTVDHDYQGEIKVILHNVSDSPITLPKFSRIAQAVVCDVVTVQLEETQEFYKSTIRGDKGLGSTGIS